MSLYSNFQAFSNSIKLALSRKADKTELSLKADKTEIPTVPTNVSAFTNDAGYLTDVPTFEIWDSGTSAKYTNSEILSMFSDGKVMTFLGNPVMTVTDESTQAGIYYTVIDNGNPVVNKITVNASKTIATGTRPTANFADVSGKENKGKMTLNNVEETVVTHTLSVTDGGATTTYTLLGV